MNFRILTLGADIKSARLFIQSVWFLILIWSSVAAFATPLPQNILVIEAHSEQATAEDIKHAEIIQKVLERENSNVEVSLISGDLRKPEIWLSIREFLNSERVEVVNMSIAYPLNQLSREITATNDELHKSVRSLIDDYPEVLFVVSSGNGIHGVIPGLSQGVQIDSGGYRHYPAALKNDNIISVGSIAASDILMHQLPDYRLSQFSNFGLENVDILAPGEYEYDGEYYRGTSFAAPFLAAWLLRLREILEDTPILQLKEILLKTAYVPNLELLLELPLEEQLIAVDRKRSRRDEFFAKYPDFLPVRSGGIILPEASLLAAEGLIQGMGLNEAVFAAFEQLGLNHSREDLTYFWQSRAL